MVGSDGLVPLTPWQLASRLASTIWETTPDDTLLQAAQAGQLTTAAQVASQVTRMLADPRAANGLFYFNEQWLFNFGSQGRDLTQPLTKSSPLFTAAVAQGIATEFSEFVSSVYTGDGTLKSLFTAPYTYVNHDLGGDLRRDRPGDRVRQGLARRNEARRHLHPDGFPGDARQRRRRQPGLSRALRSISRCCAERSARRPPTFRPSPSSRTARPASRTRPTAWPACATGCHNLFDPPGFAFENYDGVGSYRTTEADQSVDATGSFVTPANATITFQNALDLSTQLAQSAEAQTCIDRQWTRFMLGRPETTAEAGSMSIAFQKAAATAGFSLRDLMATLIQSKAFMYRRPPPARRSRLTNRLLGASLVSLTLVLGCGSSGGGDQMTGTGGEAASGTGGQAASGAGGTGAAGVAGSGGQPGASTGGNGAAGVAGGGGQPVSGTGGNGAAGNGGHIGSGTGGNGAGGRWRARRRGRDQRRWRRGWGRWRPAARRGRGQLGMPAAPRVPAASPSLRPSPIRRSTLGISAPGSGYHVEGNIPYGPYTMQRLDVMYPNAAGPKGTTTLPGIIMFHGGGWIDNKPAALKASMSSFFSRFLKHGFLVCNVEYRLADGTADGAIAPAADQDALLAAKWFWDHMDYYHVDKTRYVTTGASAGGQLALMVGMATPAAQLGPTSPTDYTIAAIVNGYGPADVTDLLAKNVSFAVQWLPANTPNRAALAKQVSPVTYVRQGRPAAHHGSGRHGHDRPDEREPGALRSPDRRGRRHRASLRRRRRPRVHHARDRLARRRGRHVQLPRRHGIGK